MKIVWLFFATLVSCTHAPMKAHLESGIGDPHASMVFPYGHYRHQVQLTIHQPEGDRKISFEGIVETKSERILMVALSPFQTTLMRVEEDRSTGDVTVNCYNEGLRRFQSRFVDYYRAVRQVLLMARTDEDLRGDRRFRLEGADGELSSYTDRIPRHIEILDPRFGLEIEVTSVEIQ